MTDGRPRTFAALLRASLPTGFGDWMAYVLAALALRFFLGLSLAATAAWMAVAIPVSVAVLAAARYALGRVSPPAEAGDDDGR